MSESEDVEVVWESDHVCYHEHDGRRDYLNIVTGELWTTEIEQKETEQ